jgi:membrane protein implicated in regulation of membrane protease activity
MLFWVGACFVSILVHELGHALAARACGWEPWITLHGFGGLASYQPTYRSPQRHVLITFAGGALVGALLALADAALWAQVVGFSLTSALLLVTLRPWLLRHLRARVPLVETNVAAQVGRSAVVVAEVTERGGRVKLSGEVWTARTENDEVIAVGTEVDVVRISGATAVVRSHAGSVTDH